MKIDLKRYLDAAREAALAAGQQLRVDYNQIGLSHYKGDRDPVTQADLNAERVILEILREQFPQHSFLSEEIGLVSGQTSFCWIIDPLDGTVNFLHRLPHFAISIALQKSNTIIVGVIYQPMADELYSVAYGQGAYLNRMQLKVSSVVTLSESLLGIGFGTSLELRKRQQQQLSWFLQNCGAVRETGSAVIGLCNVATGSYDGYWELGLQLWDVAAGALLITEAGGAVSGLSDKFLGRTVDILVSNGLIHQALLEAR